MFENPMKDKKVRERFYLEAAIQRSGCGAKITREGDDQGQEPAFSWS